MSGVGQNRNNEGCCIFSNMKYRETSWMGKSYFMHCIFYRKKKLILPITHFGLKKSIAKLHLDAIKLLVKCDNKVQ